MGDLTERGFGLVIAYLLPGFVLLLGVGQVSPDVGAWLRTAADSNSPTVGTFLYLLLASLTAGMTLGAFRWAIVDRIHHATGLVRPQFELRHLHERLDAFELFVHHHYRYYEFFANTLLAALASYLCWRLTAAPGGPRPADAGFLVLEAVFFAASRDTLRNYYRRAGQVLGTLESEVGMTNGSGHHEQVPATTSPRRQDKPQKPAEQKQSPAAKAEGAGKPKEGK